MAESAKATLGSVVQAGERYRGKQGLNYTPVFVVGDDGGVERS